jgi:hypothetical protein
VCQCRHRHHSTSVAMTTSSAPTALTPPRANGGTLATGRCPSKAEPSTSPSSGPQPPIL